MKIKFVPVRKEHLRRLNEIINNPAVAKYLSMTPPSPMKGTIEWYNFQKKSGNWWWAIKSDDKIAGSINLMRRGNAYTRQKLGHVIELGISIDKNFWNMGLGKNAVLFAKKEAKKKGFKRLELFVIKANKRAVSLYKKCGFKEEGTMKKFYKIGNKYHDAIMMSQWLK